MMKKILLLVGILLLITDLAYGQTQIFIEDFEDATVEYTTSVPEFTDGSGDYFQRTTSPSHTFSNIQGSGIFEGMDLDGEGATLPLTMTINDINISNYTNLEFRVYLAEGDDGANQDWDASDFVHFDYDINNTGTFTNLLHIESSGGTNTEPAISPSYDGNGNGTAITNVFTQFTQTIAGTGSTLDIKITLSLNSGDEDIAFDNIEIYGTSSDASPTKLAITSVNGGSSPSTNTNFEVVVQLQDIDDNPINATEDINVTLSLDSGNGSLGGTTIGTISNGDNSVTISGVTYDTAESGVSITATNTGGSLDAGTSSEFIALEAADRLVLVSVPSEGTTEVILSQFTVEARRSDSSVDLNYIKPITISIATGLGVMGGTTSKIAVEGISSFDDINFDAAGDYTIQAGDGSLTSVASSTIVVNDPPSTSILISGIIDGPRLGGLPKAIEFFVIEDVADLSVYTVGRTGNGDHSGQYSEYTLPSMSLDAGTFFYVASETDGFNEWFGFNPDFTNAVANNNGDDTVELILEGSTVDIIGDINTDGTGQTWEYDDGWAYRKNVTDGAETLNTSDWYFSGKDVLNGETTNADASIPFPTKTFTNGWFAHLSESPGYRLLSTPVTTSYSDILDEIWTQGASTGADATNGTPNVFTWSKTSTNGDNTNWSGVTNLDDSPTAGEGFLVYVYADDDFDGSDDAFPKTLSVSGTENGSVTSLTLNQNNDAWTLLGNPFASSVDFDEMTKSELTGVAYVWDDATTDWKDWNGVSGDLTNGIIAPFQGFFVQNDDDVSGTADVDIETADKASGGTFYGKTVNNIQRLRLNVKGDLFSNSAWIQLSEKGSINDKVFGDALELQPLATSYAQLGFIKSDEVMNIAHLNTEEEVVVPIEFNTTEGGLYTISATDFEISGDTEVTFHDYQEAVSMVVDGSFSYTFEAVKLKKQDIPPLSMLSVNAMQFKSTEANRFGITIRPTSVNNEVIEKPKVFALEQNYPNPFNPSTTISYTLSESGAVNIGVYNLMGQRIATLVDEYKTAGTHNISWNAQGASSGMYYYRLESNGNAITRKMTLIK